MTISKELSERIEALIGAMDLSVNVPASRHLPIIAHENAAVIAQDLRALLLAAQGQEWRDIASAPRDGGEPFWIGAPGFIALAVWNVGDGALRLVRQQIAGEPFGGEPTHWCPHALPNFIPPNPSAAEG